MQEICFIPTITVALVVVVVDAGVVFFPKCKMLLAVYESIRWNLVPRVCVWVNHNQSIDIVYIPNKT